MQLCVLPKSLCALAPGVLERNIFSFFVLLKRLWFCCICIAAIVAVAVPTATTADACCRELGNEFSNLQVLCSRYCKQDCNLVIVGLFGCCHLLHLCIVCSRRRAEAVEVRAHSLAVVNIVVIAPVGVCCPFEARLLCRAVDYDRVPFFNGYQFLKVTCGIGSGFVCLSLVLPVNDISIVKYLAINHLLGVELLLPFVGDGDACCLELCLLLVKLFSKIGYVPHLV